MAVVNAPGNLIGGTTAGAGNLISGNQHDGVALEDTAPQTPSTVGNKVQGNLIGTDNSGTGPLPNGRLGVRIIDAKGTLVGGTAAGSGNVIAFNGLAGVGVVGRQNSILSNSIFANDGIGIDLSPQGVTLNDLGDGDTGASDLLNYPLLTMAVSQSAMTYVEGIVEGPAGTPLTVQFFASSSPHPTGYGEGELLLATASFPGSASGAPLTFAYSLPVAVPAGQWISATATDSLGNTSEYSPCVQVQPASLLTDVDGDGIPDTRRKTPGPTAATRMAMPYPTASKPA